MKSEVKDEILENKFGVLLDRKTTFAIERELEHLMDGCSLSRQAPSST